MRLNKFINESSNSNMFYKHTLIGFLTDMKTISSAYPDISDISDFEEMLIGSNLMVEYFSTKKILCYLAINSPYVFRGAVESFFNDATVKKTLDKYAVGIKWKSLAHTGTVGIYLEQDLENNI